MKSFDSAAKESAALTSDRSFVSLLLVSEQPTNNSVRKHAPRRPRIICFLILSIHSLPECAEQADRDLIDLGPSRDSRPITFSGHSSQERITVSVRSHAVAGIPSHLLFMRAEPQRRSTHGLC